MEGYSIIPDYKRIQDGGNVKKIKAAVLAHLFYEDQVEYARKYLDQLPDSIDLVILSSKVEILNQFQDERYIKIRKENRGRDISALLVAARTIVFRYRYICFVHDKKEKRQDDKEYVDLWRKNMWDNMLQSPAYVYNVLDSFEEDDRLGILVPLPPHKGDKGVWLKGNWGGTFELVRNLANEIGITADICHENPPVTYSTVFWARTAALEKLFLKEWKYTDFPDEPMRDYGEINHAVERILQYVAEDAGYMTKIALSSSFVSDFIPQLKSEMNRIWDQMETVFAVRSYRELDQYSLRLERMKQFKRKYTTIYLYGAGNAGKDCLKMCSMLDIEPVGILVSDMRDVRMAENGIRILPLADFVYSDDTGVIISVYSVAYQDQIKKELDNLGFRGYMEF